MEVRGRVEVPGADATDMVETFMVEPPSEESTKGLQGMLASMVELQRKTQDALTEIVNRDPSSATADPIEDMYGEEGAGEEPEGGEPPKKKKKERGNGK
mmetsp:Transcript_56439/g.115496  ORF Transcript_56439/g.115496 Transcript_56439/m.115496 type:complete len:99 (+) Transcript_56439:82-378(+)|eukprot:CAMPEP_0181297426 /NCGR_PEP_ID=MMETSP1101-20121128/5232_1 /TAXON_ID=46948 /ORGANISM="Rhodomonas abbreviata, Strain Caron Lab Isolate" /LENGTH=98 /DNA_ID=CAMNT_0023402359 /DNA_START=69 /DNA_END=365 /DNA_ORIENTATION=+